MTVTEFLEARIAEDEAGARNALEGAGDDGRWGVEDDYGMKMKVRGRGILIYDEGGHTEGQAAHIARWDPARVLAECAAKQQIISSYVNAVEWSQHKHCAQPVEYSCMASGLGDAIRLLAAVYSDHPDYDKGWAL